MNNITEPNNVIAAIRKVRKKFVFKIFALTLFFMLFITLVIPSIFNLIIFNKTNDYARILSDLTQFQEPVSSVGYTSNIGLYKSEIGTITSIYRGWNIQENAVNSQKIIKAEISVPSLKIDVNENYGVSFYSKPSENANTENIELILKKNPNRVGIVNYTLREAKNIEQIKESVSEYDVRLLWLAVLTGLEYEHSDTVNMGQNIQYRQFGFPTSTNINNEFKELDYNNPSAYLELLSNEWKWCSENKDLVKSSKDMLVFQDMQKAIDSNFSIYGVTIVGTTEELLKLCDDKDIVTGNVYGIYPWDWTE